MNLTGTIYRTGVITSDNYNELKHKPTIDGVELKEGTTLDELGAVHYEEGKTLSSNDFTDELKAKTEASIDGVTVNGEKVVAFAVPTKTSELVNDSDFITSESLPDLSKYLTMETAQETYTNKTDFETFKTSTGENFVNVETYKVTTDGRLSALETTTAATDETVKALKEKVDNLINAEEVSY